MTQQGEMLPTERIGRATWLLAQGRQMTVRQVAEELEITPHGAYQMLVRLSRVLPLSDDGGVWRVYSGADDAIEG
jgi:predicted DNA-binding transcriptional regulator YafY